MSTTPRTLTARLSLAAALLLGLGGASLAQADPSGEVQAQDLARVQIGANEAQVRQQFGAPATTASYLFAPGKAWVYYVEGGTLGNEHALQINFNAQGKVESARMVDASFYALDRFE